MMKMLGILGQEIFSNEYNSKYSNTENWSREIKVCSFDEFSTHQIINSTNSLLLIYVDYIRVRSISRESCIENISR